MYVCMYVYVYIYIYSPMAREAGVQSQVESYQTFKKWYLISTQYYKVHIKSKVEQSKESGSAFPYTLVL